MDAILGSFKPMFMMLGVLLALVIAFKVFLLWWNSPKQKGKRG